MICRLRKITVPEGYEPHSWSPGNHLTSLLLSQTCWSMYIHTPSPFVALLICFTITMYYIHIHNIGKSETLRERLCSILAQFEFQYRLQQWHDKGIDFKTYLYVPEVHPETGEVFVEREDEAHVLKVCRCFINILCYVHHTLSYSIENRQPHTLWWTTRIEPTVFSRSI